MIRFSFVISIVFYFSFCAFPETELEKLWEMARINSVDLHSAEYSYKYAESSLRFKRSLYPVSLSSSLTSSFNDTYENVAWYTSSSKANLSITKKNPFGNSISAGLGYGIDRGILNYSFKEIDSDDIGYSQCPSVNLSLNQSLMPAIAKGLKDPNSEILRRNVRSASYSKDSVEKQLVEDVTYYYIQARCTDRLLEKYKKFIAFYDLKIESAKELLAKSKISSAEIWSLENKKWDYYKDYIDCMNSRENIDMNLKNLCGDVDVDSFADTVLPETEIEIFSYNPAKESVLNEIETLKLQNILNRQDFAPLLTIGGSFSEFTETNKKLNVNYIEDKNCFNWTFSLGLSFSEFFSPAKKLRNQMFENNLAVCEDKMRNIVEQTEHQRKNYEEIILLYEKQLRQVSELHENRVRFDKDYALLFKSGKCSRLEMEEVHLNVIESECIYKNLLDNLWLYKWKRSQCI